MEQYGTETVEYTDSNGDDAEVVVTVCNFATTPSCGQKWSVCPICGIAYPHSKMIKIKGKYYCNIDGEELNASNARRN